MTAPTHVPSPRRAAATRTGLLVVDLQTKLLATIGNGPEVVRRARALLEAAELLAIPAAATVQYPRGLGPLEESLRERLPTPEEKLDFSAAVCRRELDRWSDSGRDQVTVVGIETHVCVEQTVLDLLAEGRRVFVPADAVAARHLTDHDWSLRRVAAAGAVVTTTESLLFAWCHTANRPEFKTISGIVKRLSDQR